MAVLVGVEVGVFVGVFVGVEVFVAVGVFEGVGVLVEVGVFVGVDVLVGVLDGVGVWVWVGVGPVEPSVMMTLPPITLSESDSSDSPIPFSLSTLAQKAWVPLGRKFQETVAS